MNRRSFISKAAIAATALVLTPNFSANPIYPKKFNGMDVSDDGSLSFNGKYIFPTYGTSGGLYTAGISYRLVNPELGIVESKYHDKFINFSKGNYAT